MKMVSAAARQRARRDWRGHTRSGLVWCYEPADQFDQGVARHHRLWLPAGKHAT